MANVKAHYDEVLSDVYSWMFGGFASGIENNIRFFEQHRIHPQRSGVAIDLGAGCGFQSIPLAQAGFSVTAIDIDAKLLDELKEHSSGLEIRVVRDDLLNLEHHMEGEIELIVCMTDTLLHLESRKDVIHLFEKVYAALEKGGRFIITFRDLSTELSELDRFIAVQNDADTIFTCFLEYEPETVKVHDLVYKRNGEQWDLNKSYYRKIRLSPEWINDQLTRAGFTTFETDSTRGFVTVITTREAHR